MFTRRMWHTSLKVNTAKLKRIYVCEEKTRKTRFGFRFSYKLNAQRNRKKYSSYFSRQIKLTRHLISTYLWQTFCYCKLYNCTFYESQLINFTSITWSKFNYQLEKGRRTDLRDRRKWINIRPEVHMLPMN